MKKLIFILLFICNVGIHAQETAFFVQAHQDDAVFFAGVALYDKISANVKTVCIVVTAGDGGASDSVSVRSGGNMTTTYPFYLARDYGYKKAVEYCYTSNKVPLDFPQTTSYVQFSGKTVRKWMYGNVTIYFLDLPDGGCCSIDGMGYSANSYQTLSKLRRQVIPTITNITKTTTYTWCELKNTVRSILEAEKGDVSTVYSSDTNFDINPKDHPDHYMSSALVLEAMEGLCGYSSKLHVGYELDNKLPNLSKSDEMKKISTFGAMMSGGADVGYSLCRHLGNTKWLISEYVRDAKPHEELIILDENLKRKSDKVYYSK